MSLFGDLVPIAREHMESEPTRRHDNSLVITAELANASRLVRQLSALGITTRGEDRLLAVGDLPDRYAGERLLARLLPDVTDAALAVVTVIDVLQAALDEIHDHGHTEMLSDSLLEHITGQHVPPQTVAQLCDPAQPWSVSNATVDWITDTATDHLRDAPFGQRLTGTQQQEILARLIIDRACVTGVAYPVTYYELAKALAGDISMVETARLLARDTRVTLTTGTRSNTPPGRRA